MKRAYNRFRLSLIARLLAPESASGLHGVVDAGDVRLVFERKPFSAGSAFSMSARIAADAGPDAQGGKFVIGAESVQIRELDAARLKRLADAALARFLSERAIRKETRSAREERVKRLLQ